MVSSSFTEEEFYERDHIALFSQKQEIIDASALAENKNAIEQIKENLLPLENKGSKDKSLQLG